MAGDKSDRLTDISVLRRREIEARIVAPLLEELGKEFDRERVLAIARDVIVRIARQQGEHLAELSGDRSLIAFADSTEAWKAEGALEVEWLERSAEALSFNVTRCRYAEMYRALGMPELGALLSCNRDFSLIEGFNPHVTLTRTQTIMQGAPCCDFRFRLNRPGAGKESDPR